MAQDFLVVLYAFQGLMEVRFIVMVAVKNWIGLNRCGCLERKDREMKVAELIRQLEPYRDFDIEARVHLEVMKEELQKRTYKFPHDTYNAELSVDDIGHSDKVVLIGVEIMED